MPNRLFAFGFCIAMCIPPLTAQPSASALGGPLTGSDPLRREVPAPRFLTGNPTVASTSPPYGIAGYVAIQFSEAVNVTTDKTFKVVCGGVQEVISISPTPPGGAVTFDLFPSPAWPTNTTCNVTVLHKGVTSVSDGSEMLHDYQFSFDIQTE